jgi:hypothetical protein
VLSFTENDANESEANVKTGLAPSDLESRSVIRTQSTSSQEEKNVDDPAKSTAKFSNGRKTKETSTLAKAGKAVPGEAGAPSSEKAEVEPTLVGAAVRSSGESDGDDWMNTGKFPDLESRIDKMRKDVLKMSSSILSQFDEEHVFGGSLHEPTSFEEGGKAARSSSDAGIPNRKGNRSGPGGKEPEASSSVQKQASAFFSFHVTSLIPFQVKNTTTSDVCANCFESFSYKGVTASP